MKRYMKSLLLAATLFSASACVTGEVIIDQDQTKDDARVLLHLSTPSGFGSASTRGLSLGEEREIENVYVLEFDSATTSLKSINEALVASNDSSFAVTLEPSEAGETSKLMVLANAETVLSDTGFIGTGAAGKIGDDYDDVCAAIYGVVTNKMYTSGGAIPMWGETGAIEISPDNSNNQSVTLTRSIARIDVGVGDAKNTFQTNDGSECEWTGTTVANGDVPFRLSSVHVFRVNDRYALIPDATKLAAEEATVPAGTTKFDYDTPTELAMFEYNEADGYVTNDLYIIRHIYVPEADIEMGGTKGDTNHKSRMAIVVGGVYDSDGDEDFTVADEGAPTYYRLDFAGGGTLMNVLRNHLYQFNINSVTGDGYDDPVEAYESQAINMSCTILAWNEGATGYEGFDGTYHLSLSPDEMFFYAEEESTQTLTLDTDYPTWTATVSANSDGTGAANWLTLGTASGTGSAVEQAIAVTAEENTSAPRDRTAWITVKAGERLAIRVKVTQNAPGFKAVKDVIGYIWNPGQPNHLQLTLDGDKDYFNGGPGELQSVQDQYRVYVAYFKFGSLVATSSQYASGFNSDDIIAWPTQWAADRTAMEGEIGTWTSVPVSAALAQGAMIGTDLPEGLGDPCDYWFGDHDGNGATATATENWRLPTSKENTVFVGGASTKTAWQNWVPGSGIYTYSATAGTDNGNNVWPYYYSASGVATTTAGTFAAPASGHFPVAAQTGRAAFSEVLPAAGYRTTSGSVDYQGVNGAYWSSTAYSNSSGYGLHFLNTYITPAALNSYALGLAVRCVQPPVLATSLAVTPTSHTFDWDAKTNDASQVFTVTSDGPWTTSVTAGTASDFTVVTSGVDGNGTITVTPTSNNTSLTAKRTFTITVTATGAPTTGATAPKTVTVTQNVKLMGGYIAAPGVIGYIKGTNILTIRGSKEFLGTPVMTDPSSTDIATATALATDQPLENATVYVAYFKFGSLVATSSDYGVTAFNPTINVIDWPTEWAPDRATMESEITGTSAADSWDKVPAIRTADNLPSMTLTELSTIAHAIPANGMGDPCIYWDDTKGWDGDWKLPTYGKSSTYTSNWYPEGGSPFGTVNDPWSDVTNGSQWIAAGTYGLPAGAVGGDGAGGQDWSMFLPAAGSRTQTGIASWQGTNGGYWSSTVYPAITADRGAALTFSVANVTTGTGGYYPNGYAVRCVQPPAGPTTLEFTKVLNGDVEEAHFSSGLVGTVSELTYTYQHEVTTDAESWTYEFVDPSDADWVYVTPYYEEGYIDVNAGSYYDITGGIRTAEIRLVSGDGSLTSSLLTVYQYPEIQFTVLYPGNFDPENPTTFVFDSNGDYFPDPSAYYQTPTAQPMFDSNTSYVEVSMDPGMEDWLTIQEGTPNAGEYTFSVAPNYGTEPREGHIHIRVIFFGLAMDYATMEYYGLSKVFSIPVTQYAEPAP